MKNIRKLLKEFLGLGTGIVLPIIFIVCTMIIVSEFVSNNTNYALIFLCLSILILTIFCSYLMILNNRADEENKYYEMNIIKTDCRILELKQEVDELKKRNERLEIEIFERENK